MIASNQSFLKTFPETIAAAKRGGGKSWEGKCLAENTKPSRRKRQILGKFSRKRDDKAVNFHPQYRLSPRKKGKQARRA